MRAPHIRRLLCLTLGLAVCIFAQTSQGRTVEGFEAGDPAVTGAGDAGTQGTFQGEAPPQGTVQYLITTIRSGDGEGLSPLSGTSAITDAALETFFHGITTLGGTEGSGVLIPFTILAGDTTLTLSFDFLSTEPAQGTPRNDFAFEALFNSSNVLQGSVNTFVSVASPGVAFSTFGAGSPFLAHTGFQTLTLSLVGLAPGTYSLGLGVEDALNFTNNSGLLIDNVQVVPEPSIVGLGVAGAVLLIALRRVIKKTS